MTTPIRWGILGTGKIAIKFALGLQTIPDAQIVAVGSRAQNTADEFGNRYDIPHRHASYEALVNDPDVDVIYVSTPHPMHKDNAIMSLQAGKHVLCEKPFTVNAKEAREVVQVAREEKRFLMEAMWTRFLPAAIELRKLIDDGVIGDIMLTHANFGFRMDADPNHRLFNLDLGGGALLDAGIYPVSFSSHVFGKQPDRIATLAHFGATGVDEQAVAVFGYDHNQTAICTTSTRTALPRGVNIMGSNGMIQINNLLQQTELTLSIQGETPKTFSYPFEGNGYNYEAMEVMQCIRAGKLESETIPLDETIAIMETMDAIRNQWGLVYPME